MRASKTFRDKDQAAILEVAEYTAHNGQALELLVADEPTEDPNGRWASIRLSAETAKELRDFLTEVLFPVKEER